MLAFLLAFAFGSLKANALGLTAPAPVTLYHVALRVVFGLALSVGATGVVSKVTKRAAFAFAFAWRYPTFTATPLLVPVRSFENENET
eukprot:763207-Pyramimonas_sp.AAC.1